MVNFTGRDLRGGTIYRVRLRGFDLSQVRIDGQLDDVVINGVDIGPLIDAELDRRDPERVAMRPTDADGFRAAWPIIERRWAETVADARTRPPASLHVSVDDEWSFIETLRHLVYATDIWLRRVILGDPRPWHPLDLPFDEIGPDPELPWDRAARPSLDEVLALRRDRMDGVAAYLETLTDAQLATTTEPVDGPSWPPPDRYPINECLLTILSEEWQHREYAVRDLAQLPVGR